MVFITIAGSLACNGTPELNIEATVEALADNRVAKIMEQATAEALLRWPVPTQPSVETTTHTLSEEQIKSLQDLQAMVDGILPVAPSATPVPYSPTRLDFDVAVPPGPEIGGPSYMYDIYKVTVLDRFGEYAAGYIANACTNGFQPRTPTFRQKMDALQDELDGTPTPALAATPAAAPAAAPTNAEDFRYYVFNHGSHRSDVRSSLPELLRIAADDPGNACLRPLFYPMRGDDEAIVEGFAKSLRSQPSVFQYSGAAAIMRERLIRRHFREWWLGNNTSQREPFILSWCDDVLHSYRCDLE